MIVIVKIFENDCGWSGVDSGEVTANTRRTIEYREKKKKKKGRTNVVLSLM